MPLLDRYGVDPALAHLLPQVARSQAPTLPPVRRQQPRADQSLPGMPPFAQAPLMPGQGLPGAGVPPTPQGGGLKGLLSSVLQGPGSGQALGILGSYLVAAGSPSNDPGARGRYLGEGLRAAFETLAKARQPGDPFTLGAGQGRYAPGGELIAERPEEQDAPEGMRWEGNQLVPIPGYLGFKGDVAAATRAPGKTPAELEAEAAASARGAARGAPPDARTTAQKDAEAMGLQPGSPAYNKYILDRTTKPGVQIDLGQKAGVARTEALVKLDYERLKGMQEQITQFADLEPRLDTIALGLESGSVDTGRIRGALFPLRQIAAEAGVTIDETLPQAEQVRAAMAFLTPRMRVVGSGQTSDFEMRQFQLAAPQFQNSTEGNILLARTFSQVQKRNRKAYDLGVEYFRENGSLAGVNEFIESELGPVFPMPKTQEEFDEIPAGTVYFSEEFGTFVVKR